MMAFSGHVQLQSLGQAQELESAPIDLSASLLDSLSHIPGVRDVVAVGYKAAIAHQKEEFEGVLFKGIEQPYPIEAMREWLSTGKLPATYTGEGMAEVLIPESLARRLRIKPGDRMKLYFLQNPIRARVVVVSGFYRLGIEAEFGRPILLGPIDLLRRINDWSPLQAGQVELHLNDGSLLPTVMTSAREIIDSNWEAYSIEDRFANLFGWLSLFDLNKRVMLLIMLLVCGVNILSALLILILERVPAIGLLKSLGMENSRIRLLFVIAGLITCLKGLFWGNLFFWGMYAAQGRWGFIPLDEENYYVNAVPMHLHPGDALGINGLVLVFLLLVS